MNTFNQWPRPAAATYEDCGVLPVKCEPSHLICGIRRGQRGPTPFKSAGVQTHLFHFVEEADEPGHPSQPDQAEDAHKHEYPHHLVGFGGVVIAVVLQILELSNHNLQIFCK